MWKFRNIIQKTSYYPRKKPFRESFLATPQSISIYQKPAVKNFRDCETFFYEFRRKWKFKVNHGEICLWGKTHLNQLNRNQVNETMTSGNSPYHPEEVIETKEKENKTKTNQRHNDYSLFQLNDVYIQIKLTHSRHNMRFRKHRIMQEKIVFEKTS